MDTEELQLRAPAGKFRVIGFALRDGQNYVIGDYDTREAAENPPRSTAWWAILPTSTTTAPTSCCAMEVGNDPGALFPPTALPIVWLAAA